ATGNSSIGQLAFYQKAGFRIVAVEMNYFVNNYEDPIYENGILCRDLIRLVKKL
ncbi:GNAT family N-acetyltransferase, partial [Staphylococcus gallinarum]